MSSVTEDMRAIDLKDVSAVAAVQDARPLHEGNDEHHANHAVRGAQGSHRALTAVAVPTRNQHQGTDNNTPSGTVDVFQTNVTLVPPPVTAHPVPAFAYYHPQGWMPGFGPYSHPLLIPHYPGYQVAPQMTPPFLHGTGMEGTQSPLGPAPPNGLESGSIVSRSNTSAVEVEVTSFSALYTVSTRGWLPLLRWNSTRDGRHAT
ncbi:hypothetical protein F5J12DRAFT_537444 [Pisolithus orientalis]|uniref:uncharacterized protein n=1 Tax=Pisolithus orientalis TaxID=936130 RepID=UPI002224F374|nr:uncharacterized protein F5J12DRAFT_537444 [Pisolithus orientalis]KAI6012513.1 hypothetical protein F5J12DRAFT_537444 [Pisolithus orientalis]